MALGSCGRGTLMVPTNLEAARAHLHCQNTTELGLLLPYGSFCLRSALTVYLLCTFVVMDLWKCVAGCQADSDKPTGSTSLFILMRLEQQKLLWCSSTSETAA